MLLLYTSYISSFLTCLILFKLIHCIWDILILIRPRWGARCGSDYTVLYICTHGVAGSIGVNTVFQTGYFVLSCRGNGKCLMLQVGLKCKHSFVDFDLLICVHFHLYCHIKVDNKKRKSAVCLKHSDRWDSLISPLSALPGEHFSTKPWLLTSLSGDKTHLSYPASQTSKSLQGSEMFKKKKSK